MTSTIQVQVSEETTPEEKALLELRAQFATELARWADQHGIPIDEFAKLCGLSLVIYNQIGRQLHDMPETELTELADAFADGLATSASVVVIKLPKPGDAVN
jgi:hypothetical protein